MPQRMMYRSKGFRILSRIMKSIVSYQTGPYNSFITPGSVALH
jgi:hypothetical protein